MLFSLIWSSQTHVNLLPFPIISYTAIKFYKHKNCYVTILHEVIELLVADLGRSGSIT